MVWDLDVLSVWCKGGFFFWSCTGDESDLSAVSWQVDNQYWCSRRHFTHNPCRFSPKGHMELCAVLKMHFKSDDSNYTKFTGTTGIKIGFTLINTNPVAGCLASVWAVLASYSCWSCNVYCFLKVWNVLWIKRSKIELYLFHNKSSCEWSESSEEEREV